jgi:hypothetical protein
LAVRGFIWYRVVQRSLQVRWNLPWRGWLWLGLRTQLVESQGLGIPSLRIRVYVLDLTRYLGGQLLGRTSIGDRTRGVGSVSCIANCTCIHFGVNTCSEKQPYFAFEHAIWHRRSTEFADKPTNHEQGSEHDHTILGPPRRSQRH